MLKNLRISGKPKERRVPNDDPTSTSPAASSSSSCDDPDSSRTSSTHPPTRRGSSGATTASNAASSSLTYSSSSSSLPLPLPLLPSCTLLEELADALLGAVAVYGMADVRALLRNNNGNLRNEKTATTEALSSSTSSSNPAVPAPALLHGDPELLRKAVELPITRAEMMRLLQSNLDVLHKNKFPADLYLSLLDSLGGSLASSSSTSNDLPPSPAIADEADPSEASDSNNNTWLHSIFKNIPLPAARTAGTSGGSDIPATGISDSSSNSNLRRRPPPPSVYVAVFDDENCNKELVYYIAVDEERRLIKVVFRGSVTVGDWMADVDSRMATVPNPLRRPEPSDGDDEATDAPKATTTSPTVSIHQGFYSYLFGTSFNKSSSSNSGNSKYETILGHVRRLLEEHPTYKIRVSGHSLGGALSTVFAFVAAADPSLPKPLTCVSFASPRVGNLEFARAYQQLEVWGWLRSIRVVNDKDAVTQVPDRLAYAVALTNSIYRHVGIELKLYKCANKDDPKGGRKHPRVHFPTCHPSLAQHMADDASRAAWNWFTRPMNVAVSWRHDYAVNHSCKEYSDRLAGAADVLQSRTLDDLVDEYMAHCHS